MYCKKCNAFIKDGAGFCQNCGEAVQTGGNSYDEFGDTGLLNSDDELDRPAKLDDLINGNSDRTAYQPQYQSQPQPQPQPQPQAYGAQNYAADISLIQAFKNFWKNYVNFSGRARRKEYWYMILCNVIISFAVSVVSALLATLFAPLGVLGSIILGIYGLAAIVPGISLIVRRLHDTGKAWYYIFCSFIPFAGPIIILVFMCQDSTPVANEWGENPKGVNYPVMQPGYIPSAPYTTNNAYNPNQSSNPVQNPNTNVENFAFCKNCGARINQNADFCPNCGIKQ